MFKYIEGGDYDEKYGIVSCDFCGNPEENCYEYNGNDYCLDCFAKGLAGYFNPTLEQLLSLYPLDMRDSVLSKLIERLHNDNEKIQLILIEDLIANEGLDWTIDLLKED